MFLKDTHELIGITVWVRTYHGQLITTMAGIVPINQIHEFLDSTETVSQRVYSARWLKVVRNIFGSRIADWPYIMKGGEKNGI